jgi:methyl-accepting chemotaxis protein
LAGFLAVVAMVVLVGGIAIAKIDSIHGVTDTFADQTVPNAASVGDVEAKIAEVRKDQIMLITRTSVNQPADLLVETRGEIADEIDLVDEALAHNLTIAGNGRSRQTNRALTESWGTYVSNTSSLNGLLDAGRIDEAVALITTGPADRAFDGVKESIASLQRNRDTVSETQDRQADSTVSSARTLLIVLVIVAAVLGIAIALLLARQISSGLRQMLTAARGIAQGDVEQTVDIKSRDEIGEAGEAFREMIAYLEETAGAARRIAAGDLAVEIEPKSERDALGNAFVAMSGELRAALATGRRWRRSSSGWTRCAGTTSPTSRPRCPRSRAAT